MTITHNDLDYVFTVDERRNHRDLTVSYGEHRASVSLRLFVEEGKPSEDFEEAAERIIVRLSAAGHLAPGLEDAIRAKASKLTKLVKG